MQNPSPVAIASINYANSARKEVTVPQMDEEQEIDGLRVVLEFTIKSSAGAFTFAAADSKTLAEAIASNLYGAWDGDNTALNKLSIVEMRSIGIEFSGLDPLTEDPQLRAGKTIPAVGGTALNAFVTLLIPFSHDGLDAPNLFAKSSDQLNANPFKIAIDCVGTGLAALVLAAGTAVVTMTDVKIFANQAEAYGVFCGPHWRFETKSASQDFDEEKTPGIELFLAQESDPVTFAAVFSDITINVDGREKPRSISPQQLAAQYQRTKMKVDSIRGADLTSNSLGGTGSQLSPLRWVQAARKAAEYELPMIVNKRKITFKKASGASPAFSFLRVVTEPIAKQDSVIRALMAKKHVGGEPKSLRTRGLGGADNDLFREYKGVWVSASKAG
jgi:hypothetical protein